MVAVDEALAGLSHRDEGKAELIKFQYSAGLTGPQAALALGISPTTADRFWRYARSWRRLELIRLSTSD